MEVRKTASFTVALVAETISAFLGLIAPRVYLLAIKVVLCSSQFSFMPLISRLTKFVSFAYVSECAVCDLSPVV